METITLTVDRSVLETAQRVAEEQHTTREAVLCEWLHRSAGVERVRRYDALMDRLEYVKAGGPYTRDEMNERC
jgi:hypothetical protein